MREIDACGRMTICGSPEDCLKASIMLLVNMPKDRKSSHRLTVVPC